MEYSCKILFVTCYRFEDKKASRHVDKFTATVLNRIRLIIHHSTSNFSQCK